MGQQKTAKAKRIRSQRRERTCEVDILSPEAETILLRLRYSKFFVHSPFLILRQIRGDELLFPGFMSGLQQMLQCGQRLGDNGNLVGKQSLRK